MDVAKLVLGYVNALIWPTLLVLALLRFRPQIQSLFGRVAEGGGQVKLSAPGFELLVETKNTVAELAENADQLDASELREAVKEADKKLNRYFLALTANFYGASIDQRRALASEMRRAAKDVPIDDLLDLARAPEAGERVGAAIGLGERLKTDDSAREDSRVLDALAALVGDRRSFVRYRAAEAIGQRPELAARFGDALAKLAAGDPNPEVRRMAQRALRRA